MRESGKMGAMAELTIQQAFALAVQQHKAGRWHEAEQLLGQISQQQPGHAQVLRLQGAIAHQLGRDQDALNLIRRAIAITPTYAEAHYELSTVLVALGQFDEAVAACRQAISLRANYADAFNNLGVALKNQGRFEEAITAYQQAISIAPTFPEAHSNLGNALRDLGRMDEAIAAFRQAIAIKPDYALAHNNLGVALRDKGQFAEAIAAYRQAIALHPGFPQAHTNLGNVLRETGQLEEAIASHLRALAIDPNFSDAYNNLGIALKDKGPLDEAIAAFRKAVALKTSHAEAYNNLGNALKETGSLDEAIAAFRSAIAVKPSFSEAHSNLIYTLHFHPGYDVQAIAEEHRRWNRQHAAPIQQVHRQNFFANDRGSERRLRIGYVSPDFRSHVVGRFFMPLLEHHDRGGFEIFCYSNVHAPDAMTDRIRSRADAWRDIVGVSDAAAAEQIREDKIDVLVDLAMHTARNRLLVFAHKPAPVQVTYLAYCSSSGLDAMDYRLTDPHLDPLAPRGADPAGGQEDFYSEQSIRLPEVYWCYDPGSATPDVAALPALNAGYVTFGCLNSFAKASAPALATWIQILRESPSSRFLLHARQGEHRRRTLELFKREGIDPGRLTFVDYLQGHDYLRQYHQIDIALDPFPYAGGTTTCDALWMGVPIVTLRGQTAVGRAGVTLLASVGLNDLVATTREQHVRRAVELANDLPRLAEMRAGLRDRMRRSPLMDAPRFARNVETAYRQMWRRWCGMPRSNS